MNYIDFTANDKTYKLRLNTRNIVALEKQLGCNPIHVFGDGDKLPTLTQMIQVLHSSLQQLNHGISLNDTYDIFDEYLADGHTMSDFVYVIMDVYRASGLIPKENKKEADNEKN